MKVGVNEESKMSKKFNLISLLGFMFGLFALVAWMAWGVMGLAVLCAAEDNVGGLFAVSSIWAVGTLLTMLFARAPIRFLDVTVGMLLPLALEQLLTLNVIWNALGPEISILGKVIVCTISAGALLFLQVIKTWYMRTLFREVTY